MNLRDSSSEADMLLQRARELEEEIALRRDRIRTLRGLSTDKRAPLSNFRELIIPELVVDLPPLELPAAHEALIDALHRETGFLGMVRTNGHMLEWKSLGGHFEFRIGGERDKPTLHTRGNNAFFYISISCVVLAAIASVVALFRASTSYLVIPLFLLAVALAFMAAAKIARRLSAPLLRTLSSSLPARRIQVRVEQGDDEAEIPDMAARPGKQKEVR